MLFSSLVCLLNHKGYKANEHKNYISIENSGVIRPIIKEDILGYDFKTMRQDGKRITVITIAMKNDQEMVF